MKTKRGIELDLNSSAIKLKYNDLTFYFSSILYKEKFQEKLESYILEEQLKINLRYRLNIKMQKTLAIALYKKIEKRGFKIYSNMLKRDLNENECYLVFYENITKE